MNKNIIPYLKYTEFEDVYKPNHFHTGHDFFIFPKNYSFYDSTKKNISYFPNHISEYNQIIPEYDINNISYIENKRSFNNNILSETRELSPINNNNFLYTKNSVIVYPLINILQKEFLDVEKFIFPICYLPIELMDINFKMSLIYFILKKIC